MKHDHRLPWEYKDEGGEHLIYNADGEPLLAQPTNSSEETGSWPTGPATVEDFKLVVRACNSHTTALEALKKASTCASINSDVMNLIRSAIAAMEASK